MNHRKPVLLALLTLSTLGASWLVATPATALEAPTTCQGKPVTIVATMDIIQGTEGDDVVAMEPDGWREFDALGGNDTVCLAAGAGLYNPRDPFPPAGNLDAGPGDDVVIDLAPRDSESSLTAILGPGNDSFIGADRGETVYAEKHVWDSDEPVADPELTGAQRDIVSGASTVYSSAPTDGLNADSITFGTLSAEAVIGGPTGPGFLLDVARTPGPFVSLQVPHPSTLRRGTSNGPGELLIDNEARTVTLDGEATLAWTGTFTGFQFGSHGLTAPQPTVSFAGTSADEGVTVADVPVGDFAMGAGDDSVSVESWNTRYIPRSADGGPGSDTVNIDTVCSQLVVRLGGQTTCNNITSSGSVIDFETAYADSSDRSVLIGTDHSELLVASADFVRIVGRGGADKILVHENYTARVAAGRGPDRVWAVGDDVILRGQQGRDRLDLRGSAQIAPPSGSPKPKQVALGGPGPDSLFGTTYEIADRLVGGSGRDRADGRAGRHDTCLTEVTRRCELP